MLSRSSKQKFRRPVNKAEVDDPMVQCRGEFHPIKTRCLCAAEMIFNDNLQSVSPPAVDCVLNT